MRQVVAPGVAALRLLREHAFGWLVAIVAMQGAVSFVVLQLLGIGFRALLDGAAIDGINQTTLLYLLRSPVELLALLVYCAVAVVVIVAELGFFAAFAAALWDGAPFTFATAFAALRRSTRVLWSWQAPVLLLYVVLILPISRIGIGSTLTQHIAIPKFVSGELVKTTAGAVVFTVGIVVIVYAAFRLMLTVAYLVDTDASVFRAMGRSVRATRRMHGRLVVLLAAVVVAFVAVVGVVALAGLGAVAVAGNAGDTVAAVALVVVGVVRFVAVGVATVFLSATLVALRRQRDEAGPLALAIDERRVAAPAGTRRWSVVLLAIAGVVIVTQGVGAVLASASTSDRPRTLVVAHRGYVAGGVENSIPALRAAHRAGADMVELDIQETEDGGFVVLHDTNLRRLAGVDRTVYDMTTAELTRTVIRQDGHTAHIPTLRAFATEAERLDMPLLVEVKPHGHERPGFADRVASALRDLDPGNRDWVQSLDADTVAGVRRADPSRTTAFVVGLQLGLLPRTDAHAVVIEDWSFADAMLANAHARGQQVFVWTIDDRPTLRRFLGVGVDGIITDEVATAVADRDREARGVPPVERYVESARDLVLP
jgi:glycerophosphoryl diester phosphodiesterase